MKTNILKEAYLNELKKVWDYNNKSMVDSIGRDLSECYQLSTGELIAFDKQKIKKDFCFGYSIDQESYDQANEDVIEARKNTSYFIAENLAYYDNLLNNLKNKPCYLVRECYQKRDGKFEYLNLFKMVFYFYSKILEERERGQQISDTNEQQVKELISFVENEKQKQIKKINTYLKKYGLSKVHSWSYWRDE